MAKVRLKKRGDSAQSVQGSVSRNIPVEDVNGNKHILKATVFSVDMAGVRKDMSQEIIDDKLEQLGLADKIVKPPLSQTELAILQEVSSELAQTIEAMQVGIEGFGARLIERPLPKEMGLQFESEIREEKVWLETFLAYPNPEGSFVKLRKETRGDLERTGNAYWELLPSLSGNGRYASINRLDVGTMRISRPDDKFTRFNIKYINNNITLANKPFLKRFRRFVQIVGKKKVYFKEFGDPRIIDKRTGEVADEKLATLNRANEVFHFKIPTSRRTPYGMPRFTGNIIAVRGSRSADETNIITQQNNHVPSMAITVSGGQLTDGSLNRIQEFVDTQIKADSNYSKFLLIEGESTHDTLSGTGSVKIDIKPLSNVQHKDQLWQDYDKNNAEKLRRSFRLPPILVGKADNYDKAGAQTSERMAERYVFSPEREEMDHIINKILVHQGFRFWVFRSNSPNVTDDQDLVRILTGAERTGGLTPRISRMLLEDILNRPLPEFPTDDPDFNPDLPFSFTLAKLMHNVGEVNQNGTMAPQGQTPKAPGKPGRPPNETADDEVEVDAPADAEKVMKTVDTEGPTIADAIVDFVHDRLDTSDAVERLVKRIEQNPKRFLKGFSQLRNVLEDSLDIDAFGKPERNFFEHEH